MMVATAAMVTVSCGSKKEQAEGGEATGEQTEQAAGENGYITYDNKLGYTIDIPGGMFKYKNKILDEKDGEEKLLQYTLEKDNIMSNKLDVSFKEKDPLTADDVKKDFEEWKGNYKDAKIVKEELKDDSWTLIVERENSVGDIDYYAFKQVYNMDKKVVINITFEYGDNGKEKFTEEVINHVFDSIKFK